MPVELRALLGMVLEPVEELLAVGEIDAGLPVRSDAGQLREHREGPREVVVLASRLAQRAETEPPVAVLGDEPEPGGGTQDAVQRRLVEPGRRCELRARPRPAGQALRRCRARSSSARSASRGRRRTAGRSGPSEALRERHPPALRRAEQARCSCRSPCRGEEDRAVSGDSKHPRTSCARSQIHAGSATGVPYVRNDSGSCTPQAMPLRSSASGRTTGTNSGS